MYARRTKHGGETAILDFIDPLPHVPLLSQNRHMITNQVLSVRAQYNPFTQIPR